MKSEQIEHAHTALGVLAVSIDGAAVIAVGANWQTFAIGPVVALTLLLIGRTVGLLQRDRFEYLRVTARSGQVYMRTRHRVIGCELTAHDHNPVLLVEVDNSSPSRAYQVVGVPQRDEWQRPPKGLVNWGRLSRGAGCTTVYLDPALNLDRANEQRLDA